MDTAEITLPEVVLSGPSPNYNINLFMDDAFYRMHPEKILGEAFVTSGRFGEVTKYKGDITALERIEVPDDFIGAQKIANDPLTSTDSVINFSGELMEPATADFIKEVNRTSELAVMKGAKRKKDKGVTAAVPMLTASVAELNSFEDIYAAYNPEISREELEVYIWYKTEIGKPLSKRWAKLIDENLDAENLHTPYRYSITPEQHTSWVNRGLIFYFGEKFLPAFLYLAGDIYAKKFQLTRDKDFIIEKFGGHVYDNQDQQLTKVFSEKYSNRLTIGGEASDSSLVILPISKFAANFFIERLESMGDDAQFKIKKVTAASATNFGKPDFAKDAEAYDRNKEVFEKLSLTDAFGYWLMRATPELKENVTHAEIIKYYLQGSPMRSTLADNAPEVSKREEKAQQAKLKSSLQKEGERLFKIFLDSELTLNDKVRLETEWNAKFNNFIPVNFNKIPVAFTMAKYYLGRPESVRPEKREAVAFTLDAGAACIAYDVGVGKTLSAILTISAFMDAGYCRRPFICVPNQVYKQFISEIKGFVPHIPVIEAYNLGDVYVENFKGPDGNIQEVPDGTITVMTYEGLEQIGFNETTAAEILGNLYMILDQGGESEKKQTQRQKEGFEARLQTLMGRGLRGTLYNIEDFGFDFGTYDEAHKLKKVFTSVKGEATVNDKGKTERGKNPYLITSGTPSSIGLKAFMLNQYILRHNGYQNVLLLTATPFTNSPLEIFSMLAMLAYEQLQSTDLNNIKNFFDTYIATSSELVINAKLKPEFRQVITGFNNLISMQTLIRRYINYKTGEDVNVVRPNKYVLPLLKKNVDGTTITLGEGEKVETYLSMTPQQKSLMDEIISYVEGGISLATLEANSRGNVSLEAGDEEVGDEDSAIHSEGEEVDDDALGDEEKAGVRILRGMSFARNLALSPYLYELSGMGKPDYISYIETSPKLKYVMECIRSVRDYHLEKGEAVSGQVIYMDRGIEYFGLIRDYLINEVGYKPHEVGIIKSGMVAGGKKGSKEYIKNLFNGEIYNEATKLFEQVSDAERIKVIIGSSTIKEGINLQRYGTVLYNCFIDWNPTDIQQLEGRIWRQKNTFSNVRIVNPLVIDSMDIFIFQKLQEKTQRLNTIWATDGKKNVLNLAEFDPSELKYALIRDPRAVAQLMVIDEKTRIDSEILGITRLSDRIERIKEMAGDVNNNYEDLEEIAVKYRGFVPTKEKLKDAQKIVQLVQDVVKKQTDKEGLKLLDRYEMNNRNRFYHSGEKEEKFSDLEKLYKPYSLDKFNLAQRNLNKEVRDFIQPSGIKFKLDNYSGLDHYKDQKLSQVADLELKKKKLEEPDNINRLVEEIVRDREEKKITYKPLAETVRAFASLNYLLSDRVASELAVKPAFTSPPPMEGNERLITDEAVSYLESEIAKLPQTKDTNANEQGIYTDQRTKLHEKLIADAFKGVRCVVQGKPIAVFTAGAPASGKTRFLRQHAEYLLTPEVFHLDADSLRAQLPEYKGWNAAAGTREVQDIVSEILKRAGSDACKYDVVFDGTMNRASKYFSFVKRVKDMGYETFIIFVEVPYGVSRTRALERYKAEGRYVPMSVIDEFFEQLPGGKTRGSDALDQLKKVIDGYIVIDGETGKIIDRGGKVLPQNREYGKLLNEGESFELKPTGEAIVPRNTALRAAPAAAEELPPASEIKVDKEQVRAQLKALELGAKYLEGAEKNAARGQINALKLSLKYF